MTSWWGEGKDKSLDKDKTQSIKDIQSVQKCLEYEKSWVEKNAQYIVGSPPAACLHNQQMIHTEP